MPVAMAKSLRFVALAVIAVATAENVEAAPSSSEMAATLAHASDLMTRGISAYLLEAKSARTDREARDLIHSSHESAAVKEVEEKAMHMASQMLANLRALAQAAKKLEGSVAKEKKEAPKAQAQVPTAGAVEGTEARLETQVAGLRETNHELEEEKRSLISSVQQMLHGNKANELHEELKTCHAQLSTQDFAAQDAKAAHDKALEELRSENSALAEAVQNCQKSQGVVSPPMNAVATEASSAASCANKLRELQEEYANDAANEKQVTETVNLLTRENEALKEKVAAAGHPAPCVSEAAAPEPTDVAHMAETTKIDMYISQSEGDFAATPGMTAKVQVAEKIAAKVAAEEAARRARAAPKPAPKPAANTTVEAKPIRLSTDTVQGANSAVAGEGAIGQYLRGGGEKPAKPAAAEFNSTGAASGNPGIEQALETIAKEPAAAAKEEEAEADDGDDLARRLLLQAEHNLKLASI